VSAWGSLRSGRGRFGVLALIVAAVLTGASVLVAGAGATSSVHMVTAQRAAAVPAGATALGAPAATAAQTGDVALKPRDPAALKSFVASLTDKTSANYHQYLKGGAFAAKFGPTQATIAAVRSALTASGLKISSVASDGMVISFSGTTSQVESAFGTTLERYRTASGTTGEETTSAVKLPSDISSDVAGVVGLNTLFHPVDAGMPAASKAADHADAKRADITSYPGDAPKPCAAAQSVSTELGGLTDDQIANAYGAFGEYTVGDDGAGVHVGLFELEPFEKSDIQTFDECYFGTATGDSMVANQLNTLPVDGGQPDGYGSGEAVLDIDDVSAMAPGADIDVYEAPNTDSGYLDEFVDMVDSDSDQIISSSWGECENIDQAYEPGALQSEYDVLEQAAAQGQTILAAAGDTGNDSCNEARATPPSTDQNPLSVLDPASQPDVLGVGGTSITDADPAAETETVWNSGGDGGAGGGGISAIWTAPSWQQTAAGFPTPTSSDYTNANTLEENAEQDGISDTDFTPGFCQAASSNGDPCRTVPDISANADPNISGVTIYSAAFGWTQYGGTSSATPIWAAMLALTDASATCQADNLDPAQGGTGIGFASPLLYAVAQSTQTEADGNSEYDDAFHDVTSGNNDVYGFNGGATFPATTGYDLASGLGSPQLTDTDGDPGLAVDLCGLAAASDATRPTISSLSDDAGPVTGGNTVTVTGTNFSPATGDTVTGVTVGSYALPAADFSVTNDTTLSLTMPAASATLGNGSTTPQDGAGPARIIVTMTDGNASAPSAASTYDYYDVNGTGDVPAVTSVGPYSGTESGTPATVTIYGADFAAGDTVTFGGQPATAVSVVSPYEMTVTPPAFDEAATSCETSAALLSDFYGPGTGVTNAAAVDEDDICQTNVVVSNANGSSTPSKLLPTYEGQALTTNPDGTPDYDPAVYEIYAQPTEYDYIPAPTVTSVSTSAGAADYAAAEGGTIVQINGTGLNDQTLDWVNVGDPGEAASQDYDIVAYGGTFIDIELPASPDDLANGAPDTDAETVPVSVQTFAGLSTSATAADAEATYAGLPTVSGVTLTGASTGTDTIDGGPLPVGPDTGNSTVDVAGQGFSDVVGPAEFGGTNSYDPVSGTFGYYSDSYTVTASSDTALSTTTTNAFPALFDTVLCTASGCSMPVAADEFLEYPSGTPVVTGIAAGDDSASVSDSGPASGGTVVTLTGTGLGCVTRVDFGGVPAQELSEEPGLGLGCNDDSTIEVVTPAGSAGANVPITVSTVASDIANAGAGGFVSTGVTYSYTSTPTITPSSFGSVDIGSTQTKTVTITNPSDDTQELDLNQASMIGTNQSEFSITTDGCSDTALGTGDSCSVQVAFTPTASGAQTATLDVPFNNSATDLTATLSGTGTVPTSTQTVTSTVTNTVTEPGTTTTVTTPGSTTTVTAPGTSTTTTSVYTCTVTTKYRNKTVTKTVKVRVKVKVKGKYRYEYKLEKKKVIEKVPYKSTSCALTKTTTTVQKERRAARTLAAHAAAARLRAEAKTRDGAAAK
jgi:subtilase family serine protease